MAERENKNRNKWSVSVHGKKKYCGTLSHILGLLAFNIFINDLIGEVTKYSNAL